MEPTQAQLADFAKQHNLNLPEGASSGDIEKAIADAGLTYGEPSAPVGSADDSHIGGDTSQTITGERVETTPADEGDTFDVASEGRGAGWGEGGGPLSAPQVERMLDAGYPMVASHPGLVYDDDAAGKPEDAEQE